MQRARGACGSEVEKEPSVRHIRSWAISGKSCTEYLAPLHAFAMTRFELLIAVTARLATQIGVALACRALGVPRHSFSFYRRQKPAPEHQVSHLIQFHDAAALVCDQNARTCSDVHRQPTLRRPVTGRCSSPRSSMQVEESRSAVVARMERDEGRETSRCEPRAIRVASITCYTKSRAACAPGPNQTRGQHRRSHSGSGCDEDDWTRSFDQPMELARRWVRRCVVGLMVARSGERRARREL